jgi:hypothetical protein
MAVYRFEEVTVIARKWWKDTDGKRRQRTRRFSQTLNPFNQDADGSPKTRDQIMAELVAERKAWLEDPDAR